MEVLETRASEIWIGKGSYDKRLENAFKWGSIANQIKEMSLPQVFLKKELRAFLKKKPRHLISEEDADYRTDYYSKKWVEEQGAREG